MCEQFDHIDVDSAFEFFDDIFETITRENTPKIKVLRNSKRPKRWTRKLQQKKNRHNKLFKCRQGADDMGYLAALNEFNESLL